MALQQAVGTFTITTSDSGVITAVTGLSFQPKVVLFLCNQRSSDGRSDNVRMGVGASSGPTENALVAGNVEHGRDTGSGDNSNTKRVWSDENSMGIPEAGAGSFDYLADLDDFNSDGFDINVKTTPTSNRRIGYIAFGGDDIEDVKVGKFELASGVTGSQSMTDVGFEADSLIFLQAQKTGNSEVWGNDFQVAIGFVDNNLNQGFITNASNDNQAGGDAWRHGYMGASLVRQNASNDNVDGRADVTAYTSNGFDYNVTESFDGAYDTIYIAFKGPQSFVGDFALSTSTGVDSSNSTATGFTPTAMMVMCYEETSWGDGNNAGDDNMILQLGITDGTNEFTMSETDDDNSDPTDSSDRSNDNYFLTNVDFNNNIDGATNLQSFDTSGFTLNTPSNAPGQAVVNMYMVFGDKVAEPDSVSATGISAVPETTLAGTGTVTTPQGTFPGDWNKKVHLQTDGTYIDGELTDYPVLVDNKQVSADADFWSNVANGGGEIRATSSSDGTGILPIEVVECNTSTSALQVWVKMPTMSTAGLDDLYLWYDTDDFVGKADTSATSGRNAVWEDAYTSVYHLEEGSGDAVDSTGRHDATEQGTPPSPRNVAGQIGDGTDFETDSNNYYEVTDESDYRYTTGMTVETWLNPEAPPEWGGIVTKGDGQWRLTRIGTSNDIRFNLGGVSPATSADTISNPLADAGLHHVIGKYDGSNISIWLDGTEIESHATTGNITTATDSLLIGNHPNPDREWDGVLDEVRIAGVGHSDAWIKQNYYNQLNSDNTWNAGVEGQTISATGDLETPAVTISGVGTRTDSEGVVGTYIWDGGGSDDNWTTKENWAGDLRPPATSDLIFSGSTRLTPYNDYPEVTSFGDITFAAGSGQFSLSGNSFSLSGDINQNSGNTARIRNDVELQSGDHIFTMSTSGPVLEFDGVVSGPGSVTKTGAGEVYLGTDNSPYPANTYTGGTTVLEGKLRSGAQNDGGFGTGDIILSGGELVLGRNDISNDIDVVADSILTMTNGFGNTITSDISLGSATTLTLYANYGTQTIVGTLSGAGDINVASQNAGATLVLSANENPDFTGDFNIDGTTQTFSVICKAGDTDYGSLGASNVITIQDGATLQADGDNSCFGLSATNTNVIIDTGGTLTTTQDDFGHLPLLTFNGGTLSANSLETTWGNWLLDNGIQTSGTGTSSTIGTNVNIVNSQSPATIWDIATGDTLIVNGVIFEPTSGTNYKLNKEGGGKLILNGDVTDDVFTNINDGTLIINGNTADDWGVEAESGGTLGGSGTVGGNTIVRSGGVLSPGDDNEDTLTFTKDLTFESGSTYDVTLGTVSDLAAVGDDLTIDGTVNITSASGFTKGIYTIITYSGVLTDNTLDIGTNNTPYSVRVITSTGGQVDLDFYDTISGTSELETPKTELSGEGYNAIAGTGDLDIPTTEVSGVGSTVGQKTGTGDLDIPMTEVSGIGTTNPGDVTAELETPMTEVSGIGTTNPGDVTAELETPKTEVNGVGQKSHDTSIVLETPLTELSGVGTTNPGGVTAELETPLTEVSGVGYISIVGTGDLDVPMTELSGVGTTNPADVTAELEIPKTEVSGVGTTNPGDVTAELEIPKTEVSGVGTTNPGYISDDLETPMTELSGIGVAVGTVNGTGDLDVPMTEVSGVGTTYPGGITAELETPKTELSGVGIVAIVGSAELETPMTELSGVGITNPGGVTAELEIPKTEVSGVGTTNPGDVDAQLETPMTELSGVGTTNPAYVSDELETPKTELSGVGTTNPGGITAELNTPETELSGVGTTYPGDVNAQLETPLTEVSGVGTLVGTKNATGDLDVPLTEVSGVGTTNPGDVTAELYTPETEVSGVGTTNPGGITAELYTPETVVSGTGTVLAVGTGAIDTPETTVSGVGYTTIQGTSDLQIPTTELSGIGTATGQVNGTGNLETPTTEVSGVGKRGKYITADIFAPNVPYTAGFGLNSTFAPTILWSHPETGLVSENGANVTFSATIEFEYAITSADGLLVTGANFSGKYTQLTNNKYIVELVATEGGTVSLTATGVYGE